MYSSERKYKKGIGKVGGRGGGGFVREGSCQCWSRVSIRILMCGRRMYVVNRSQTNAANRCRHDDAERQTYKV